jgi:two-component system, response regulator
MLKSVEVTFPVLYIIGMANASAETIKPRILIVEDNSNDEELLMRQLHKAGLAQRVQVIPNGNHALAYLTSEDHELVAIFLDLHLPGIGGLEILEKVRSHERLKTLPVIVMTSSNHPEEIKRCHALKVNGFVQKPVTFSAFSKAIADTFHTSASGPIPRVHE